MRCPFLIIKQVIIRLDDLDVLDCQVIIARFPVCFHVGAVARGADREICDDKIPGVTEARVESQQLDVFVKDVVEDFLDLFS